MALVYKVHIQSCSDNTTPFLHSHSYISSCKLQLAKISITATYVEMAMWEWFCVVITTMYLYILCRLVPSQMIHYTASSHFTSWYFLLVQMHDEPSYIIHLLMQIHRVHLSLLLHTGTSSGLSSTPFLVKACKQ